MIAAVARQGFALCGARDRVGQPAEQSALRTLEPLLPGFVCASAAMKRVVEQIQRLQGNDLTVLITGESGTGKELVARAIHVGSPRSRQHVPPVQLHDDHARARRQPAVRPPAGRVHRRGHRSARPDPNRRRRHAVPRRDRRPAARRAAEAAALPRAERDHAGRRDAPAARRRARDRGDQRRPRAARGRRQVPRGPVLPAERDPDPRAAAARAARGDPAPERALPARGVRAPGQAGRAAQCRSPRPLLAALVAGQRAAAAERDPARGGA